MVDHSGWLCHAIGQAMHTQRMLGEMCGPRPSPLPVVVQRVDDLRRRGTLWSDCGLIASEWHQACTSMGNSTSIVPPPTRAAVIVAVYI